MRNYFNYYTEIEQYFVLKRAKNLMVSPMDWCLVELWKEQQIPLHIVLRGIDRSFDSAAASGKRSPTTLYYCHPAVLEAWEEHQRGQVGAGEATEGSAWGPDRQRLVQVLGDLSEALVGRPEPACQRARERLDAMRKDCLSGGELHEARLDRELASIQSALVKELSQAVPMDRQQELEADAKAELAVYGKRLGRQMLRQLQAKYLERKYLEELGLPELSLLGK